MTPVLKLKGKTARLAVIAVGVAAAASVGALFPKAPAKSYANTAASEKKETAAVRDIPAEPEGTEAVQLIEYRKAGIDEYQVLAAVSAAPAVEVVEADETDPEDQADFPTYTESFAVTLPEDGTQVYDPQPEKLNYTATRSISNEYFTAYDLRSRKTVTMNAFDMVCQLVYSEIGAEWNEEAIKAQAVASYSNLRFNDGIGLIPTVGLRTGYPEKLVKCVKAVEGQCIYYNGGIANAVYCASTAGYTADCEKIFGISYGYLKPVVSKYDSQDINYGVKTYFSESEIRNTIQSKYGISLSGDVASWFTVESIHSAKYVGSLSIDGGKVKMSGEAARRLFGLKSSAFEITYSNGEFCFTTYGYGHGVGFCQWGAKYYADNGWSYDQILRHYFVNTTVKVSPASQKAIKRGGMSAEELAAEIDESKVAAAESVADKQPQQTASAKGEPAVTSVRPEEPAEAAEPEEQERENKDKEEIKEETPAVTEPEQGPVPEEAEPAEEQQQEAAVAEAAEPPQE